MIEIHEVNASKVSCKNCDCAQCTEEKAESDLNFDIQRDFVSLNRSFIGYKSPVYSAKIDKVRTYIYYKAVGSENRLRNLQRNIDMPVLKKHVKPIKMSTCPRRELDFAILIFIFTIFYLLIN